MVISAALPALFAAGAGGAAAGAVGLTAFGSAALTIGGSVLAGAATGYMKKKEIKEAEEAEIREEQRAEDSFAGIGDAIGFSNEKFGGNNKMLNQDIADTAPLGRAPKIGDIYKQRAEQKRGKRSPRIKYDHAQGIIQQL